MKYCLFLIIVLLPLIVSADSKYNTIPKATIDSILQKEVKSSEDIDLLIDVVNGIGPIFTKYKVLKVLKLEPQWNEKQWYRFRVLHSALKIYYTESREKSLEPLIEYIELADKEKLILSMNGPLGEIRKSFQDNHVGRLKYYQKKLAYYRKNGPKENMATCFHGIAGYYLLTGNFNTAITYYLMAAEGYKDWNKVAYANEISVIGACYFKWGNFVKAKEYLEQSISLREKYDPENKSYYAKIYLAKIPRIQKIPYDALKMLKNLLLEAKLDNTRYYTAVISLEMAQVYLDLNQPEESLTYLEESKKSGDSINLKLQNVNSDYEIDYAYFRYFIQTNQINKAEKRLLNALKKARQEKGPDYIKKYYKELLGFYYTTEQYDKSSDYGLKYLNISDSLTSVMNQNAIAKYEVDLMEFENREEIIRIQQKRKVNMLYAFFAILFLVLTAIGLYFRMLFIRKSKNIIEKEKERSENLLLNILPAEVAEELKENGKAAAKDFETVSILFTDFKKFTQVSEKLSARELVEEINACFEAFDNVCEKYNIEKIKTIGDSYMAAGGIPVQTATSVKDTVLGAIEMQAFITKRKSMLAESNLPFFEMRAGINTGPVVAGIVGVKKFQYDIWGDTVNTASRMESNGEVGTVNISHSTYELLKDDPEFEFESRGKIPAKGKGEIDMYFVKRV